METKSFKNELSLSEARSLIKQVQQAHLLLSGFHMRLLPLLGEIAAAIDETMEFWNWSPIETNVPPRGTVRPTDRSAWDFSPLYAFQTVYARQRGLTIHEGDRIVAFWVYLDDSFESDKREEDAHPDPLNIVPGNAIFRVFIFKPKKTSRSRLESAFDDALWIDVSSNWQDAGGGLLAVALEWDLAEVIANPNECLATLKKYNA